MQDRRKAENLRDTLAARYGVTGRVVSRQQRPHGPKEYAVRFLAGSGRVSEIRGDGVTVVYRFGEDCYLATN